MWKKKSFALWIYIIGGRAVGRLCRSRFMNVVEPVRMSGVSWRRGYLDVE